MGLFDTQLRWTCFVLSYLKSTRNLAGVRINEEQTDGQTDKETHTQTYTH